MNIAYLPIDERPCNTDYVRRIADSSAEVKLFLPPQEALGYKKLPADKEMIWKWITDVASEVEAIILSIDMLIYGGLLPSRIHYLRNTEATLWIERLRSLRKEHPGLLIYASNLIMRTPKYSSSDEEPDYYEEWGEHIFLRAYLQNKKQREHLKKDEELQLQNLINTIPKKYIDDYEERRAFNSTINTSMLKLVKEGTLTFLAIPQDDSSEYGYTSIDQAKVMKGIEALRLHQHVQMYPGADEVGATLLARVYTQLKGKRPRIYPIWSSTLGPQLIPMYEDRPYQESLKAHIFAAGCQLAETATEADIILAYNTPGRVMQESWDQSDKDITYTSFRHLLTFVDQIKQFLNQGKQVIVADCAYANGGDKELITLLDEERLLDRLLSYKGWNTNCNSLGTTLCQGVLGLQGNKQKIIENIIYHIIDDYIYQAEVRMKMVEDFLPLHNLTYFNLKDKVALVNKERNKRVRDAYQLLIHHSFETITRVDVQTFAPWNRMFECGLILKCEQSEVSKKC